MIEWFILSLAEQLGNVGSEVHRAVRARGDEKRFEGAPLEVLSYSSSRLVILAGARALWNLP